MASPATFLGGTIHRRSGSPEQHISYSVLIHKALENRDCSNSIPDPHRYPKPEYFDEQSTDTALNTTDKLLFQSFLGGLYYSAYNFNLYISFSVSRLARDLVPITSQQILRLKYTLRFLRSTPTLVFLFSRIKVSTLTSYSDTDYAPSGDLQSTSAPIDLTFGAPISWSSKIILPLPSARSKQSTSPCAISSSKFYVIFSSSLTHFHKEQKHPLYYILIIKVLSRLPPI